MQDPLQILREQDLLQILYGFLPSISTVYILICGLYLRLQFCTHQSKLLFSAGIISSLVVIVLIIILLILSGIQKISPEISLWVGFLIVLQNMPKLTRAWIDSTGCHNGI